MTTGRLCEVCGGPLSRYNPEYLCRACKAAGIQSAFQARAPEQPPPIGARLRELRHQRGLSRQALADLAGLSHSVIKQLETGRRQTARFGTLAALCAVLDEPVATLYQQRERQP